MPGPKKLKLQGHEALAIGNRVRAISFELRNPKAEIKPLMLELERIGLWLQGEREKLPFPMPPLKARKPRTSRRRSPLTIEQLSAVKALIESDEDMTLKAACKQLKFKYDRAKRYLKVDGYTVHTDRNNARMAAYRAERALAAV